MSHPEKWNYTKLGKQSLAGHPGYGRPTPDAPNGTYQDRRIIGSNTPINRGVAFGGSNDALVVDDERQPELNRLYRELLESVRQRTGGRPELFKADILGDVLRLVERKLKYDPRATIELGKQVQPNTKVAISQYLNAGVGVCLHQALVAAYLLEKLKSQGLISGKVTLRRPLLDRAEISAIQGKEVANFYPEDTVLGHAFVEYTNSAGDIFIIDPAMHYVGPLKDLSPERQEIIYRAPKQ